MQIAQIRKEDRSRHQCRHRWSQTSPDEEEEECRGAEGMEEKVMKEGKRMGNGWR